jgi:hypothetical protein
MICDSSGANPPPCFGLPTMPPHYYISVVYVWDMIEFPVPD